MRIRGRNTNKKDWEFRKHKYRGVRTMIGIYRDPASVKSGRNPAMYIDDETATGYFTAYVELPSYMPFNEVMYPAMRHYYNGGYTYFKANKDGSTSAMRMFPDGTKAKEGMYVAGWDYNHMWDEEQGGHDIRDVESDIERFVDAMNEGEGEGI